MTILVDGDALVYRCGFAGEKTHYLAEKLIDVGVAEFKYADSAKEAKALGDGHNIWTRKSIDPIENVLHTVKVQLENIRERFKKDATSMRVFLAGAGNYRTNLATRARYKGNRDHMPKPFYYSDIRSYLVSNWGASYVDGQEVDDTLGIEARDGDILVHNDKDINQVEGYHYNPFSGGCFYTVSKPGGYRYFLQQTLMGDSTDNIPGIEGIGEAKAKKILEGVKGPKDGWARVAKEYAIKYGLAGKDYALEAARLVRIRRQPGEIWSPPN